jgi:hypothetical protein
MLTSTLFGIAALAAAPAPAATPAHPPPRQFVRTVDNPWFPLLPGSVYRYRGSEDGARILDVVRVTHRVRRIEGVPTTAVRDRLFKGGHLAEATTDFYAQTRAGTVWYFGEATRELDRHGHVTSREGSWRSGVRGGRAGIFMPAHPRVGRSYRQEFLPGHAEDHFRVVARHTRVSVPFVTSRNGLRTHEWTPLEPGVLDLKVYVRGIGDVLETTLKGGSEHLELVSFTRG